MKINKFLPLISFSVAFGILSGALVTKANAASLTWTGSTSTNFTTNTNWAGNVEPANNTTADIGVFGSTITANQPSISFDRSVSGLVFQSATGGWTFAGPSSAYLILGASGIDDSANTSGVTTINTSMYRGGGGGPITFTIGVGGLLDVKGSFLVDFGSSVDTTINGGVMSVARMDSISPTRSFTKAGTGTLKIDGAAGAPFQGNFNLNAGTVIVGNKDALGYNDGVRNLRLANGFLQASTNLSGTNAISRTYILDGSTAVISGTNNLTLSGDFMGADNRILTNSMSAGSTFEMSGTSLNISSGAGNNSFSLYGNGTTLISGNLKNGGTATASTLNLGNNGNTGYTTLSGSNSYAGITTFAGDGVTTFAKQVSLYSGNSANWTRTNLVVNAGHTLAYNVGGTGEFTAGDVTTLLTNLTTGINNNGYRNQSFIGFDTTNAAGGNFTVTDAILNSTGTTPGTVGLRKLGANSLTLTNVNTYSGATIVNAGTLLVNGAGSINATSGVTVTGATSKLQYDSSAGLSRNVTLASGATLAYNSLSNYSGTLTFTNGTLAGTNWDGNLGGLTIGAGQTISPGNSPGIANTTTQTWASLGTFDFEINDATGNPGSDPGWDLINLSGVLNITATAGSKFTINVISLTSLNVGGNAENFNSALNYDFLFAEAGSTITSFSADKFTINASDFTNALAPMGSFSVVRGDSVSGGTDNQLYLSYNAVPEPGTMALLAGGMTAMLFVHRRRTRKEVR